MNIIKIIRIAIFVSIPNYLWGTDNILCLKLPIISGLTRADLYYKKSIKKPAAVLVLCPGVNGNGSNYLKDKSWLDYANDNNLGIIGLSFASQKLDPHNEKFYYYASNGSGQLLIDGINEIYGKDVPILIYGFSGGAHFTARFVAWQGKRVLSWCAYSAGWWDSPPTKGDMPNGIIACGTNDSRLKKCINYFWAGREQGKFWLWIEVQEVGHVLSSELDSFVRKYFTVVLDNDGSKGMWVDIYNGDILSIEAATQRPSAAAWLPHKTLYNQWLSLNRKKE